MASTQSSKPAIIVVQGAYHVPEHFADLISALQDLGYEVEAPCLTSVSVSQDPGDTLQQDTQDIAKTIRNFTETGKDVILHMHSMGGISGSEAVHLINSEQKANPNPSHGKVLRLIYLASFIIYPGDNLVDCYKGYADSFPVELREGGMLHNLDAASQYYTGTPKEIADAAVAKIAPMAVSVISTPPQYCGWRDWSVPVTYVLCEEDLGLHAPIQEKFVQRMQNDGVDLTVKRIKSDHSPFLHMLPEYLEILKPEFEQHGR